MDLPPGVFLEKGQVLCFFRCVHEAVAQMAPGYKHVAGIFHIHQGVARLFESYEGVVAQSSEEFR